MGMPLRAWSKPAATSSIAPDDLVEYEAQCPEVRNLIRASLALTRKNLGYRFGSNSPDNGGMDCSGTVQHVLNQLGISHAPRTSRQFFQWVNASGSLHPTKKVFQTNDPALKNLKPGDLLFWAGTYQTGDLKPAVSHVMIYLGTLKRDGKGVMFGSSDGRRYRGKRISGVSVFDFKLPSKESSAKFLGYGPVPGFQKIVALPTPALNEGLRQKKGFLERLGFKKKNPSPTRHDSAISGESPAPSTETVSPAATSGNTSRETRY